MTRLAIILTTIVSLASFITAWQFQVVLDPSNPVIPLGLAMLGGFGLRHAFSI